MVGNFFYTALVGYIAWVRCVVETCLLGDQFRVDAGEWRDIETRSAKGRDSKSCAKSSEIEDTLSAGT